MKVTAHNKLPENFKQTRDIKALWMPQKTRMWGWSRISAAEFARRVARRFFIHARYRALMDALEITLVAPNICLHRDLWHEYVADSHLTYAYTTTIHKPSITMSIGRLFCWLMRSQSNSCITYIFHQ